MNILLADDHVLFRDALIQFMISIHPDWSIDSVCDLHAVIEKLQNKPFDLVLLDLRMPGMNRLKGLEKLVKEYPDQKIAIITGVAEEHHIREAIQIGVCGYLPKTLSGKALVKAINTIITTDKAFVPSDLLSNTIMPSYHDDFNTHPDQNHHLPTDEADPFMANLSKLTDREQEVLTLLAKGLSNKEIARDLNVQTPTVKLHVSNVCKKLCVNNRTQAAIMAHQYGIVPKLELPAE